MPLPSERVRWLQAALRLLEEPALAVDGLVGPATRAATRRFQARTPFYVGGRGPGLLVDKLDVDGIAGPKTRAALLFTLTATTARAVEFVALVDG